MLRIVYFRYWGLGRVAAGRFTLTNGSTTVFATDGDSRFLQRIMGEFSVSAFLTTQVNLLACSSHCSFNRGESGKLDKKVYMFE